MRADALAQPYLCTNATGVLVQAKKKCRTGHFWVLALIGELYTAEQAAQATAAGDAGILLAERHARVAPIVEAIRTWVAGQRALPQSTLGKALAYTTELWPGLVAFLDHAAIPLDNNATERALRGIALGRNYADLPIMQSRAVMRSPTTTSAAANVA